MQPILDLREFFSPLSLNNATNRCSNFTFYGLWLVPVLYTFPQDFMCSSIITTIIRVYMSNITSANKPMQSRNKRISRKRVNHLKMYCKHSHSQWRVREGSSQNVSLESKHSKALFQMSS